MPQLLFIPGLACDAALWRDQLVAFASWQPQVAQVHLECESIPAMAAALLAHHDGPLLPCGASMGGMIAMEMARQAPERIAGLALLGTDARPDSEEMKALRSNAIGLFEQGRLAEVIEPNIAFAFHPDNAGRRELTQAYLDMVYRGGAALLIRQNRAVMARPDAREHLPRLTCPALVAVGEADKLTPPERAREIASLLPKASLHVLPGCGHMLTMEQPQAVNALLARWLEEAGAQGGGPAPSGPQA